VGLAGFPAMATYLPLKPGCTFHPFQEGPTVHSYVLCTPDQRQFRISASAYEILRALEAGQSLEEIHASMGGEKVVSFSDLHQLLTGQYQAALLCDSPDQPGGAVRRRQLSLLLHHTLIPQQIVIRVSEVLSGAYQPTVATFFCLFIVLAHLLLYGNWTPEQAGAFHPSLVLVATFFSVVVHEFGHSSAVTRFDGKPGSIGAGLYILLPVLYADVSRIWTFRQKQRVIVDLGGIYFQQAVFAGLAFAAVMTGDRSLRAACISIDAMTLVAINPVFRFDGYWVLVDALGMPNLHRQAGSYLKQLMRSLVKLQWKRPDHVSLNQSRFKTALFLFYSLAGNLFLLAVIVLNLRWVQSVSFGLIRRVPAMWMAAEAAITRHQVWGTLDLLTVLSFVLASGLTLICALWLRGKELLHIGLKHNNQL